MMRVTLYRPKGGLLHTLRWNGIGGSRMKSRTILCCRILLHRCHLINTILLALLVSVVRVIYAYYRHKNTFVNYRNRIEKSICITNALPHESNKIRNLFFQGLIITGTENTDSLAGNTIMHLCRIFHLM